MHEKTILDRYKCVKFASLPSLQNGTIGLAGIQVTYLCLSIDLGDTYTTHFSVV